MTAERQPCHTKRCRNKRAWGQSRCYSCLRQRYSLRKEKRRSKRKRPGSAPSRGAGWQRARKAVSGQPCAICGTTHGRLRRKGLRSVFHVDHILAARLIQHHKLGDPHARVNLLTLCSRCHAKKRRAEDRLCNRTNIVGWLQELNRIGFPMERVRRAMEFYGIKCVAA